MILFSDLLFIDTFPVSLAKKAAWSLRPGKYVSWLLLMPATFQSQPERRRKLMDSPRLKKYNRLQHAVELLLPVSFGTDDSRSEIIALASIVLSIGFLVQ